jgi:hypothetical protein
MNKNGGKKGHPRFPIMDGHTQPGAGQMSCYRCGTKGHRAGDKPAKPRTEKFTRMLQNGSGNKTEHRMVVEKAKGKERKVATERVNLCATIGAKAMDTAVMLQRAISPTMVLKEVEKENGETIQQHCPLKQSKERRKKSWQW